MHAAVPHGDAVVHADGVELEGDAAGLADASFTFRPTRFRWTWPGMISTNELQTAMNGLSKSASVRPVAFSRLRWGARSDLS